MGNSCPFTTGLEEEFVSGSFVLGDPNKFNIAGLFVKSAGTSLEKLDTLASAPLEINKRATSGWFLFAAQWRAVLVP